MDKVEISKKMDKSSELNKFERAKVLGIRAEQLTFGAKSTIEVPPDIMDPLEIATLELKQGRIPLIIRRTMPDKSVVDVNVNSLLVIEE